MLRSVPWMVTRMAELAIREDDPLFTLLDHVPGAFEGWEKASLINLIRTALFELRATRERERILSNLALSLFRRHVHPICRDGFCAELVTALVVGVDRARPVGYCLEHAPADAVRLTP